MSTIRFDDEEKRPVLNKGYVVSGTIELDEKDVKEGDYILWMNTFEGFLPNGGYPTSLLCFEKIFHIPTDGYKFKDSTGYPKHIRFSVEVPSDVYRFNKMLSAVLVWFDPKKNVYTNVHMPKTMELRNNPYVNNLDICISGKGFEKRNHKTPESQKGNPKSPGVK